MDVLLPSLGEGAESGTVVNILVKEGDQITKGQAVIELETGKAVAPIPASAAGLVSRILVKQGQKISVGAPVLSLTGAGAMTSPAAVPADAAKPRPTTAAPVAKPLPRVDQTMVQGEAPPGEEFEYQGQFPPPASPSIRRLAHDLGIDLRKVRGSEEGGRIVLGDLKTYIHNLQQLAHAAKPSATPQAQAVERIDFSRFGPIYKRPMTELRKVIAQRMLESWKTIPHVTQFHDVDLSRVAELRKKHAEAYQKAGAKLTVTSFILKAVVNTLKKHPVFNSTLDESANEIVFKEYFHIGIAVDTEQGLIVPVIRDVDRKSMLVLSKELAELAEKTRSRRVSMDEMQGGSFTISNQGAIGGAHFTPIINKPEAAILGLGKSALKPVVLKGGAIEAREMMPVGLSYDHRVIDGADAARFIVDLAAAFENFDEAECRLG